MTVGEKIQFYRKNLQLSQEELGKKLLVSRQTISLWEKDQTLPTVDNLIKLREIFGVSVDEMLDAKNSVEEKKLLPREHYRFNYTKMQLVEVWRFNSLQMIKRFIIFLVLGAFVIILAFNSGASGFGEGFLWLGVFTTLGYIKNFIDSKKKWKFEQQKIMDQIYEYEVYGEYFLINIYKNDDHIRKLKLRFSDIEKVVDIGKLLICQFAGQTFFLDKAQLIETSVFYNFLKNKPDKIDRKKSADRWALFSWLMFALSILSIFGALICVSIISENNHLFSENMWVFFVFALIPISSIVFGFVLRSKGVKYRKNIIVGIIMTILMCVYGSFSFIFADVYSGSDEPVKRVEQFVKIDIPEVDRIRTQDWTTGEQSGAKGYIYYTSDIYFSSEVAERFEGQIKSDESWMSVVPSAMKGITTPLGNTGFYDYIMIYNTDTNELNTLPSEGGTYHFINVMYATDRDEMQIVEYDIDYVK